MCGVAERAHPEHPGFAPGTIYRRFFEERYEWAATACGPGATLDAPCGCGWGTNFLPPPARGVDISPEAVEYARRHFRGEFVVGTMLALPFGDGQFQNVVCLEGLEHVSRHDAELFLVEARRVTTDGGSLISTVPLERGHAVGNPHHLEQYDLAAAMALYEPCWMIRNWASRPVNGVPILWVVATRKA